MHHAGYRNRPHPALTAIEDLINATRPLHERARSFPVEVIDAKDAYVVRAALPGFSKEQIKIEVDGNILTLSAAREATPVAEGSTLIHTDGFALKAARSLSLPQEVDAAGASAKFELGILEARLPKFAPTKKSVQVD